MIDRNFYLDTLTLSTEADFHEGRVPKKQIRFLHVQESDN
jgi:hypothetical protein